MRTQGWFFGTLLVSVLVAGAFDEVQAQTRRITALRGSEGPSIYLGLVGGANTRGGLSNLGGRPGAGGVAQVPRFGTVAGSRPIGSSFMGLMPGRNSLATTSIRSQYSFFEGALPDPYVLRSVSGVASATHFWRPPIPFDERPPMLTAPLYVEMPQQSPYAEYFGLYPSQAALEPPAPDEGAPELRGADLMEQRYTSRMQTFGERALREFREATSAPREVDDPIEPLAAVADKFSLLRSMDADASLPLLLSVYIALERHQHLMAADCLFEAAFRNPRAFIDHRDLGQHFGDRKLLEAQARRFLLYDENIKLSPEQYAVHAYAAWVLGDARRARQALDAGYAAAAGEPPERYMELLRRAMEASLAQQP